MKEMENGTERWYASSVRTEKNMLGWLYALRPTLSKRSKSGVIVR